MPALKEATYNSAGDWATDHTRDILGEDGNERRRHAKGTSVVQGSGHARSSIGQSGHAGIFHRITSLELYPKHRSVLAELATFRKPSNPPRECRPIVI